MAQYKRDGLCVFEWSASHGAESYPHVFKEGVCVRCDKVYEKPCKDEDERRNPARRSRRAGEFDCMICGQAHTGGC